ncbi:MAG: ParM/StbA family protein [Oscillospiraceae bacterium]|jgi:glycerol-3-phosphate responsive antiterminator|nr:ParM/StbA family protein [Oscillospiraceae bacterium]
MAKKQAVLVVDFGNSETRAIVLCKKDKKLKERKFTVSNRFAEVDNGFIPDEDYSDDTSMVFNIDTKIGDKNIVGTYVSGEVQEREFSTSFIRPTAQEAKYTAKSTVLSYTKAIFKAYEALADIYSVDKDKLDVEWTVVVLLPPGDIEKGKAKMAELLQNINKIDCTFPQFNKDISLKSVAVFPEGFCAYIGTVFERGVTPRAEFVDTLKETVLVLDIGAGTTDMLIVKDNRVINNSLYSIKQGGNNIVQTLNSSFMRKGVELLESDLEKAVVTGFVKVGAGVEDVSDTICKAKRAVAGIISNKIKTFLETSEYPLNSINKLLVCGGGAMQSENEKITSLSKVLVEQLKGVAPSIELLSTPVQENIVVNEVTKEKNIVKSEVSLRELNILGASIFGERFVGE